MEKVAEVWDALLKLFADGKPNFSFATFIFPSDRRFVILGKIRPVVFDTTFEGLESVPAGLAALSKRETWGKAVCQIRPDAAKAYHGSSKL